MAELGKTLKNIYNAMMDAYRVRDKSKGAKDALAIYEENIDFIEENKSILNEIENTVDALRSNSLYSQKGSIVSKRVPCGKNCNGCPYGPYLYKVFQVEGKTCLGISWVALIYLQLKRIMKSKCFTIFGSDFMKDAS